MLRLSAEHRPLLLGLFASLLTMLYGYGVGVAFGQYEDQLKGHLKEQGMAVLATTYGGDQAKLNSVLDKSWTYMKRTHLHAGALGSAALALTLLLAMLPRVGLASGAAAVLSGLGGLGYSVFWLLAALAAPGLGSTGAAKESLQLLAMPSSAAIVAGLLLTMALVGWAVVPRSSN
jgi:hypothetical protein